MIADYVQRMLDERHELEERIGKLETFCNKPYKFDILASKEQARLYAQVCVMKMYKHILDERIDYAINK